MFIVSENYRKETGAFSYAYAVVSGLVFYIVWNIASFAGIVLGGVLGNTDELGFEFAVAAIFIAMVMPGVNNLPVLGAVLVSAVVAVIAELNGLSYGILLAGLSGMTTGFVLEKWRGKSS
jgi:branched chain amino acid efflux pump